MYKEQIITLGNINGVFSGKNYLIQIGKEPSETKVFCNEKELSGVLGIEISITPSGQILTIKHLVE